MGVISKNGETKREQLRDMDFDETNFETLSDEEFYKRVKNVEPRCGHERWKK